MRGKASLFVMRPFFLKKKKATRIAGSNLLKYHQICFSLYTSEHESERPVIYVNGMHTYAKKKKTTAGTHTQIYKSVENMKHLIHRSSSVLARKAPPVFVYAVYSYNDRTDFLHSTSTFFQKVKLMQYCQ